MHCCCLVTQLCPTLCNLRDYSLPAPRSMGFSRQEHWSGFPFPSSGDLQDQVIKARSPALQADSLLPEPPGKPQYALMVSIIIINIILLLAKWLVRSRPAKSHSRVPEVRNIISGQKLQGRRLVLHKELCSYLSSPKIEMKFYM